MKICWFDDYKLGIVEGDMVADVSGALAALPAAQYPARTFGDPLITHLDAVLAAVKPLLTDAPRKPVSEAFFHSPIANPSKIIGVPVNYLKHVEEAHDQREEFTDRYAGALEEQGLFLKANSALTGFGNGVHLRFTDRRNDHEMELGMIIGKSGANISEEDAMDYVAGFTIALDFVVRGSEDRSFRKSVDTYAITGPWMITKDEVATPQDLDFSLKVNGEVRQASNTQHMIMKLKHQIAYASKFYTLHPGDIFMTGTCEGVGRIESGDTLECWIDGVAEGSLKVSAA